MPNTKININKVDEYSKEELNLKEKEIFGFYLNHPVSLYRDNNNYVNTIDTFINRNIEVLLMVDRVKKIKDKNNCTLLKNCVPFLGYGVQAILEIFLTRE